MMAGAKNLGPCQGISNPPAAKKALTKPRASELREKPAREFHRELDLGVGPGIVARLAALAEVLDNIEDLAVEIQELN